MPLVSLHVGVARVSGLLLGATLFAAAMGQGCGCPPPPNPDGGPAGTPTLAFDGLPQTVNCETDDADPDAPGFQLEVTIVISDDDGSGYDDVEVTNSREDITPGSGSFSGGTVTVTIDVVPDSEAPGAENTLTASATNADGETITASETLRVICEDVPPPPPECAFTAPSDGDTLTASPTQACVACSGADPSDPDEVALIEAGVVIVTATPDDGGTATSVEIQLASSEGCAALALPAAGAATLSLELQDPNDVIDGDVTDEIDVTLDLGIGVASIVVVTAGADNILNIADNGGVEGNVDITSDVNVTFDDDVTGKVIFGTTLNGTCQGTGAGTAVTLTGCEFPQGISDIVITAQDGSVANADNTLTVNVDTVRPIPTVSQPTEGQVLTGADDTDAATAGLQLLVIVASDEDGSGVLAINGTAQPAATVADGSVFFDVTLPEGAVTLVATVTDGAGNAGTSGTRSITVDSVAPVLVLDAPATIDSTDDLDGLSANGIQVQVGVTPTGLSAGRAMTVESDLDNVINNGPCNSAGDGIEQQCEVTFVTDGVHNVTATATDENGNVGVSLGVTVDADTGLIGVSIDTPPIRNGFRSISAAEDTVAGGPNVEIVVSGTTAAGGIVTLFIDGVLVAGATDTADGNGAFSFTAILQDGQTGTFEVRVQAGLQVGTSGIDNFRVDVGLPTTTFTVPSGATATFGSAQDTSPAPGLQTDVQVDVTECEDGVLQVRDGATVIGTNNAIPASGTGSFVVSVSDLTEGSNETWSATCTDAEGNTTAAPDTFLASVDVTAPAAATIAVAVNDIRRGDVTLTFTEPGDAGNGGGNVTSLEVVASRQSIDAANFDTIAAIAYLPGGGGGLLDNSVGGAGMPHVVDVLGLAFDNNWSFAVRATDDVGNESIGTATLAITDFDTLRSTFDLAEGDVGAGATIDDFFAGAASGSGDLNGDGAPDWVLTASNQGDTCATGICEGAVHIFGGGGDLATAPHVVITPPAGTVLFGTSAAILRLDGDDNADLVVSGYAADFSEGRTFVYYGLDGAGFVAAAPTATITTTAFTAEGLYPVGDVSNDGFDDLVMVGVLASDTTAFLVRGGATPLTSGSVETRPTTTAIQIGSAAGATLFLPSVTGLGALDGDAFGDFVLTTDAGASANQLWVVGGRANASWPATLDLGAAGTAIAAPIACPGGGCGIASTTAGDVNGDGEPDLVVPRVGDLAVHLSNGSALATTPSFALSAPGMFLPGFGRGQIGVIGDINGDGFDDLAVGRRDNGNGFFSVFFGHSGTVSRASDIDYATTIVDVDSPAASRCGNFDGDPDGFNDLCFSNFATGAALQH